MEAGVYKGIDEPKKSLVLNIHKNSHDCKNIPDSKKLELEQLFLMDGITAWQASKLVGVKFDTARRYFNMWAEDLINDPEHETWEYRQKRVRARALEGLTKKIIFVSAQRRTLERLVSRLVFVNNTKFHTQTKEHGDNTEPEIIPAEKITHKNHLLIISYNNRIADLTQQLLDMQTEYDSIDAMPPATAILQQEILQMMAHQERHNNSVEEGDAKDDEDDNTNTKSSSSPDQVNNSSDNTNISSDTANTQEEYTKPPPIDTLDMIVKAEKEEKAQSRKDNKTVL